MRHGSRGAMEIAASGLMAQEVDFRTTTVSAPLRPSIKAARSIDSVWTNSTGWQMPARHCNSRLYLAHFPATPTRGPRDESVSSAMIFLHHRTLISSTSASFFLCKRLSSSSITLGSQTIQVQRMSCRVHWYDISLSSRSKANTG